MSTFTASDSVKCNFPVMIILCGGSPKSVFIKLENFPEVIFCESKPILEVIIAYVSSDKTFLRCSFSTSNNLPIALFGSRKKS